MVNTMLSGSTATTLKVNGNDIDVNVEYPDGEYDTLDQVKGIVTRQQRALLWLWLILRIFPIKTAH